ncbi:hypothetical protein ACLOJK_001081 [Asimina triloba]
MKISRFFVLVRCLFSFDFEVGAFFAYDYLALELICIFGGNSIHLQSVVLLAFIFEFDAFYLDETGTGLKYIARVANTAGDGRGDKGIYDDFDGLVMSERGLDLDKVKI